MSDQDSERDALLYREMARLEEAAYRRLAAVEARSGGIVASGAIVAAIVVATNVSVWTVIAAVLLAVSAFVGIAAQWSQRRTGSKAQDVLSKLEEESLEDVTRSLTFAMVRTIASIEETARTRSLLNKVGMVIQGVGIVVLIIGLATQVGSA